MKKTTIAMAFLVIGLVGTLLFIGLRIQNFNKDYINKENDIVEASKIYVTQNNLGIMNGSTYELSTDELLRLDMINSMEVNGDKCSGHVTIKKTTNSYQYKPYIKCDKYETK